MSILINLINQGVADANVTIEGKTLTTPQRIYTDGINVTYGVDVDIGREGVINENGDIGMLPLYNVPIAAGNQSLIYAEVGSPVTLSRAATGLWQVVGFAKTYPGTFNILCVTVPQYCLTVPTENPPGLPILHPPIIGDILNLGVEVRKLAYDELAVYGGYGVVCYGAAAQFIGGELDKIICG